MTHSYAKYQIKNEVLLRKYVLLMNKHTYRLKIVNIKRGDKDGT